MKYKKFMPDGIVFLYDSAGDINYYRKIVTTDGNICLDYIKTKHRKIFVDKYGVETYNDCIREKISYNRNLDIIKKDEV